MWKETCEFMICWDFERLQSYHLISDRAIRLRNFHQALVSRMQLKWLKILAFEWFQEFVLSRRETNSSLFKIQMRDTSPLLSNGMQTTSLLFKIRRKLLLQKGKLRRNLLYLLKKKSSYQTSIFWSWILFNLNLRRVKWWNQ